MPSPRRSLLLAAVVASAALSAGAPAASASLYCQPIGPVPGYGPVCTVRCVLGFAGGDLDPKDLSSLIPVCPA